MEVRFPYRAQNQEGKTASTNRETMTFGSTWDLTETPLITPRVAPYPCFDINNPNHMSSNYGDALIGSSEHSPFDDWLTHLSMLSPLSAGNIPPNDVHNMHSPHDDLDPALIAATDYTTLKSDFAQYVTGPEALSSASLLDTVSTIQLGQAAQDANSTVQETASGVTPPDSSAKSMTLATHNIPVIIHLIDLLPFRLG